MKTGLKAGMLLGVLAATACLADDLATVPGGIYRAPFPRGGRALEFVVPGFRLDVLPVTNEDFLAFVQAHPQWRRSQVERRFADESYLRHWAGDLELGDTPPRVPVTHVSLFAARAFAQSRGRRLPMLAEWEYAARITRADGTEDADQRALLLRWHSTPSPARMPDVGGGQTNQFGLHDLHGLVWEWTADFDAPWARAGADSADAFCGAGAGGARDPSDSVTFLRFALRASLQPAHCVPNLGFRCAATRTEEKPRAGDKFRNVHRAVAGLSHGPCPLLSGNKHEDEKRDDHEDARQEKHPRARVRTPPGIAGQPLHLGQPDGAGGPGAEVAGGVRRGGAVAEF